MLQIHFYLNNKMEKSVTLPSWRQFYCRVDGSHFRQKSHKYREGKKQKNIKI